ncbi:HlyD family secretion protein [Hankyongella ginsenosidimutans]|uniref:HlyD family secretion protein n=1 Tax=Hankyongella ginsenosidimutans TaxID=1763828 RepID=A0A4D7C5Q2_9SPHN|nr:HlyD family secretion protein [Hankyongella ginsenosidimutans]
MMEAQLREMRARQARLSLRAPTAGVVLERKAEVGQIAGVGSGWLFTLAKDGAVEMRGQVAEQDLPSLRIGQGRGFRSPDRTGSSQARSGSLAPSSILRPGLARSGSACHRTRCCGPAHSRRRPSRPTPCSVRSCRSRLCRRMAASPMSLSSARKTRSSVRISRSRARPRMASWSTRA